MAKPKPHIIFAYGTLKRGFPNYALMEDLKTKDDLVFVDTCHTEDPHPLVIGPHGIGYLINLPGSGHRVKGEAYAVSDEALVRLDEIEGVEYGYYERVPVVVVRDGGERVKAEAYFGHRSFGEILWKMKGEVGLVEYGEKEVREFVRKEHRPGRKNSILDILNR
ncbi:putative gamma-glutamylcyclotransferase At3g02910 [Vicia villosa]|uniref:putative gamma-glutamylcyclotransferase At3g02910 n=1 Tax=Vicia villosa TaxID=3911 RepID=UPI00273BC8D8|nr:putative gamma-glutamylcyclotransferase At3g02910 [Vicia villosa]